MAVPYRRKSRTKSRIRRASNMKTATKRWTSCAHCGEPKMPHYACSSCGAYHGRQVREVVEI
jgi:large subunit ribosomal protein L32